MYLRYRNAGQIWRLLPQILSGNHYGQFGRNISFSAGSLIPLLDSDKSSIKRFSDRGCTSRWHSTIPQVSPVSQQGPSAQVDILSFIKSAIDEFQGLSHYWLNWDERNRNFSKKDAMFVVLAGPFLDRSQAGCDPNVIFETLKLLQQRFPQVCFLGVHFGSSGGFTADKSELVKLNMNEYLTFPILLSDKEFFETAGGVYYIVFKDFKNPVIYERGQSVGDLSRALEEYIAQNQKPSSVNLFSNTWSKQAEAIKESHFSSPLQDLFLYFPGCISADEDGNRLFLSDSNHHRIIIFDSSGKILDTIGYCPGFEDGEFESAKLLRPASSFYDAEEDCLYIIDSENHAIRRADLGSRVLETVYPPCSKDKSISLWTWILDKLGIKKEVDAASDVDTKSDKFDPHSMVFPWHIMKLDDDSFIIVNRSFEKLWIVDSASGEMKQFIEGFSKISEICGDMIIERVSLMKQMPSDWLKQQTESICSPDKLPYAALMSSLTNFQNDIIMSDIVGQGVLKLNRDSGVVSNIQFSNVGILGLPYWLSHPLESVYAIASGLQRTPVDHVQSFRLLPGRIDIKLSVEIPAYAELVEPIHENCIWRQARGSAIEVSRAEDVGALTEKVGSAQKWYDELDNLAFEPEITDEETDELDNLAFEPDLPEIADKTVHIKCAVNTSPGTSEVIVYAALYLRLQRDSDLEENNQKKYAKKIADILKPEEQRGIGRDSFIEFLVKGKSDLRDLIFMKPLHVRIQIDSMDHPKAENTKGVVLTDTKVEVNVSL